MRRPTVRFMLSHPAHCLALGFGSGLAPWAPGTVGSLWAWLSFLVLDRWLSQAEWGIAIPVDPGSHNIEATAPKGRRWAFTPTLRNAKVPCSLISNARRPRRAASADKRNHGTVHIQISTSV